MTRTSGDTPVNEEPQLRKKYASRNVWGAMAGFAVYGFGALFFLVFSTVFVRWHGTAVYGQFSLMFNTLSALTLFGNYHGVIVSYSVASDIGKYRNFARTALAYSALTALPATWIFIAIGGVPIGYAPALWLSFLALIYCGLPSSAILATHRNYLFTTTRGAFQVLLIAAFWVFYAGLESAISAFAIAFLLTAILNLLVLNRLARRVITFRPDAADPPPRIMVAALITNLALMATLLVDKFALSFLHIDTPAERGVFLIYYDVIGRLSSVFVILMPALTYHFIEAVHDRSQLRAAARLALLVSAGMAILAALVGYLIPFLYRLPHVDAALANMFAAYIGFFGLTSFVVAYCSAKGRAWTLTANYLLVFAGTLGALALMTLLHGSTSVTDLALAMAIGQACSIFTGAYLLVAASHDKGGGHDRG